MTKKQKTPPKKNSTPGRRGRPPGTGKKQKAAAAQKSTGAAESTAAAGAAPPEKDTTPAPPEYPFLKTAAVAGGVILGTEERTVERDLDFNDLQAAQEELNNVGRSFREAEAFERELVEREKREHAALSGTREAIRGAKETQIKCGGEMATFCEELQTKKRKRKIPAVKTLTLQGEIIFTAADTGEELGRRTATKEELELSTGKTANLVGIGQGGPQPTPLPPASATTDSPSPKGNPDHEPVVVSISIAGYKSAPKGVKAAVEVQPILGQQDAEDPETVSVMWRTEAPKGIAGEAGRSYATVARWLARALQVVGDGHKALEFRVETVQPQPPVQK